MAGSLSPRVSRQPLIQMTTEQLWDFSTQIPSGWGDTRVIPAIMRITNSRPAWATKQDPLKIPKQKSPKYLTIAQRFESKHLHGHENNHKTDTQKKIPCRNSILYCRLSDPSYGDLQRPLTSWSVGDYFRSVPVKGKKSLFRSTELDLVTSTCIPNIQQGEAQGLSHI